MALVRGYDDETLARWFMLAGLAYVLVNVWRNSTATDSAAFEFGGSAPTGAAGGAAGTLLNVLSPMQVSPAGQQFIKKQEGWTATAKSDGKRQVIGWGHDIQPGEHIVGPIQQDPEGEDLFQGDLATAAAAVNGAVKVELTQNQLDALADLAFNIGAEAFRTSTLVRQLNAGDYAGAAQQFSAWNKAGGGVSSALVARRVADANLFNT